MNSSWRILKYVYPQWPRVVVVVISAIVVTVLLSLSFMVVIPLLNVMMGSEGLHGWLDRKACEWRYGVSFYVPDTAELASGKNDVANCLVITKVAKDSFGAACGLRLSDRIVGAGSILVTPENPKTHYPDILRELATASQDKIVIQVQRLNEKNESGITELQLLTGQNKDSIALLNWNVLGLLKHSLEGFAIAKGQWIVSFLPREDSSENKTKAVVIIMIVMLVLTAVRCIAKYYQGYMAEKVVQVGVNKLREEAFCRAMNLPMKFFAGDRPSDAVSRIIGDTAMIGRSIKIMLGKALREPLNAVFFMGFALWLNWQLTLIFLTGAPLVLGFIVRYGRKSKKASKKSLQASSQMLAKLQEIMTGIKVVKVYNRQEYERSIFTTINDKLLRQLLKISQVDSAIMPVLEVIGMAAGAAAIIVGAHWVTRNNMPSANFFALLILLGSAADAVRKSSDIWTKIQEANAASERVFAIVDAPVEFEKPGAAELGVLSDKIEFKDVYFTYPKTEKATLMGINLTVKAGQNIAVVGPNGSGKSTLVNLIPRFYDVDSGAVLIDDRNVNDVTFNSLRGQIGLVTQDVITFNDTIAANIAYGKLDAAQEEIIEAAKHSFAHEFIEPLPDGYNTVIGEHGVGLSGGQLQRIIIARAIIKNPAILIFDEATSQVDADSEAKIHKAIEQMMHDRTTFIIAHRFSTIINADVIVVMDKGQIVAQGSHEQLMRQCRLYQSLYETQVISFDK